MLLLSCPCAISLPWWGFLGASFSPSAALAIFRSSSIWPHYFSSSLYLCYLFVAALDVIPMDPCPLHSQASILCQKNLTAQTLNIWIKNIFTVPKNTITIRRNWSRKHFSYLFPLPPSLYTLMVQQPRHRTSSHPAKAAGQGQGATSRRARPCGIAV